MLERLWRLTGRGENGADYDYECTQCGAAYAARRQVCPECGSYRLERTDWSESVDL